MAPLTLPVARSPRSGVHPNDVARCHRAERLLGYGIVLLDVFDPDDYGLSGIYAYRNALGNEPQALEAEPFTAILETCPLRPFVELWRADVDRWLSGSTAPPRTTRGRGVAQNVFPV